MYNRYIRNDQGVYTRIPEEERQSAGNPAPPPRPSGAAANTSPPPPGDCPPPPPENRQSCPGQNPGCGTQAPPRQQTDTLSDVLRRILDQLHLDHVDTGDLLILLLLFFLMKEQADEELLTALGLLLIL